MNNDKDKKNFKKNNPPKQAEDTVMIKPREIIPIMAQSADPLGSYTGSPGMNTGIEFDTMPVQDADDL